MNSRLDDPVRLASALAAVGAAAASNTLDLAERFRSRCAVPPPVSGRFAPCVLRFSIDDPEPMTCFHSRVAAAAAAPPLAAIHAELRRLAPDAFDTPVGFAALALLSRFETATALAVTTAMLHRLYLACLLVACKAHTDVGLRNKDYARIVGLAAAEVSRMEATLVRAIGFRILVDAQDVDAAVAKYSDAEATTAMDLSLVESEDTIAQAAGASRTETPIECCLVGPVTPSSPRSS